MTPLHLLSPLLLLPGTLAAFYPPSSAVLNLDPSTYHSLIELSNHSSIVEFYAPWCGHCQNLAPAYEKAARSLSGLANVAAINCDEDENKPFCGGMGVKGFPTLKMVRPGKRGKGGKVGRPVVEDYQGPRTAKGIVDAVIEVIPDHVYKVEEGGVQAWLDQSEAGGLAKPKAVLFSEKGVVSALLKSVAIDFLGSIDVAQVKSKDKTAMGTFKVEKLPTLVMVKDHGAEPLLYEGEMKREGIVAFLSQAVAPNPKPAVASKEKKGAKDKTKPSKAAPRKPSQASESLEAESKPTESPLPNIVTDDPQHMPIELTDLPPPIQALPDTETLQQKCLNTKAGMCILALLPPSGEEEAQILASLSALHHKHTLGGRSLFPFYAVPAINPLTSQLRDKLAVGEGIQLVALNGKKSWYRIHDAGKGFGSANIEEWVDAIRMGDGLAERKSIPEGVLVPAQDLPAPPVHSEKSEKPVEVDAEMLEKLKVQLPEGVEMQLEEISDEEYAQLMRESKDATGTGEAAAATERAPEEVSAEEEIVLDMPQGKEKQEAEEEHDEL